MVEVEVIEVKVGGRRRGSGREGRTEPAMGRRQKNRQGGWVEGRLDDVHGRVRGLAAQ